jgi:hypothetical protein
MLRITGGSIVCAAQAVNTKPCGAMCTLFRLPSSAMLLLAQG